MDTTWWLALGVVMLLAFVAALVDGRGRLGPRRRGAAREARAARRGQAPLPRPGEIWRTSLPDGTEPLFLVLTVRTDGARLARLTSEPSPLRVLPADAAEGPAYLEPGTVAEVGLARLRGRHGEVDADAWERVRHLAE
ncbi:type II toxin-antitoxin system PemK/MazF family toxin [Streptomyces reniochalinae]|uniref:Type II toxin-antitoxin system PemK/MazF family toxin n=1 Tax=Streptomyces reniochalinae TaxID=2250578 RepID=A0A367F2J9_9ACTN|nr:type II toxin-antitoxin system PemK/MazF family toxin [Streptomyces reniochalinae]RCG24543.1 type II toxin-antitoxin system PemK/MazF family toxin [Streptomyces reniochalinae]